jgi:hypothetical protein
MAESEHLGLTLGGVAALSFTGTIATMFVAVLALPPTVGSRFPSPGTNKLAHVGWVAPAVVTSWPSHMGATFIARVHWIENMQFITGNIHEYADHLAWMLEPGVQINVLVISE